MRCFLVSCRDSKVRREVLVNDFAELPALCLAEEQKANDGYAVYASHDSRIVADAEGVHEREPNDNSEYQAGYAYACGYKD